MGILPHQITPKRISPKPRILRLWTLWEQRDLNPRPPACKAGALNQLSYAPFFCKNFTPQRYGLFFYLQIFF